jgi:hypothetical protein
MAKAKPGGWLIQELYAMHKAGDLSIAAARWILVVVYGEQGLQHLADMLRSLD